MHRIDRIPDGHPVTPMGEADLRRHLALQGLTELALVPVTEVRESTAALQAHCNPWLIRRATARCSTWQIGALLWHESERAPLLIAGASSVVQALAPKTAAVRPTGSSAAPVAPARGQVLVLAGSLSPVTAGLQRLNGTAERRLVHGTSWIRGTSRRDCLAPALSS